MRMALSEPSPYAKHDTPNYYNGKQTNITLSTLAIATNGVAWRKSF